MNMLRCACSSFVLPLALMAAVTPAAAQNPRPERPFRGLFGNGTLDLEQSLVANGSVGGGWDNNIVADALFGSRPRAGNLSSGAGGGVGQASGSLNYSARLNSLSLDASGGTTVHYYPSLGSDFLRRYSGGAGASVQVTRYLSANMSVTYTPFNLNSLFPGARAADLNTSLPDADFASSLEHYFSYSAGAGYSRQLSRRTSISADYAYRMRDESSFAPQYTSHGAGGGLTFAVTRGLGLRVGYRYMEADFGGAVRQFRNHNIDVGLDYNRTLSFSRRTMLAFSTGTSAVSKPDDAGAQTRFRATGRAELTHEMGRSWEASVEYARSIHLDERWLDVVTSDGITAGLEGLVSRRIQFQTTARASTGRAGSSVDEGGFDTYYGNASLGYALNRHTNLSLTYAYYRHRFDRGVALPADFVNQFNRHSVRASVSVWAPLFQRTRRANATR
jgi:opacity protein-like surface antigen